MKLEKITHDHLLTKWLKVIIFAILMLAPIFSVAVRCAYIVCNKNAYLSYSGKQEEYNETSVTSLKLNDIYHFDSNVTFTNTTTQNTGLFGVEDLSNIYSVNSGLLNNASNIKYLQFYYSSSNCALYYYDANQSNLGSMNTNAYPIQFDFRLVSYSTSTFTNYSMLFKLDINDESHLDNVFDYSVNELKNDQLFNWTQNTGVYTGVNAMTTGLGLTDGTISILITYWTLLSIIYVIIDIVLEGFVALTHMILKKAS